MDSSNKSSLEKRIEIVEGTLTEASADASRTEAHITVLETISMMALGLYLSNSRNDPDYSKASGLLEMMKAEIQNTVKARPRLVREEATEYAEHLLGELRKNLRALRGEAGQSH
jgi:hypothetical protein